MAKKLNRLEVEDKAGEFFPGAPPKSLAFTPPVINPGKKRKQLKNKKNKNQELSYYQPPLISGNTNRIEKD